MKQLLTTKLFIPTTRPELVFRPRLIDNLNKGLHRKMTLISAPAGFGKTTLASEWITGCEQPVAWLSLDEADNDPTKFLVYFVAALQEVGRNIGAEALEMLQSPQPPPNHSILTSIINDIATLPEQMILVLDDYHVIDSRSVHEALKFLLENIPKQIHLVLVTREDPYLPLSRLRARDQITELRAADLRFTTPETSEFLNRVMRLDLSEGDLSALETRTEGWITGLQLAALSLQGHEDATRLIQSFTGSHRLVVDYLVDEVLDQQPESVQNFLLKTAILDWLSGSLCDAVTGQRDGQQVLEHLDQVNLFIVPLDHERRWYRYHHLFADLLRQRLHQHTGSTDGEASFDEAYLHSRASLWYEDHGMEIEAFQHAAAASDYDRAERLIEGDGLPVSFRGVVTPVLNWLESLPKSVLDARPSLWVTYAMTILTTGQTEGVEEKLQAAEEALKGAEKNDKTRDLVGRIASTRANLAVGPRQAESIIEQSNRALEYLHPNNSTYRTATTWKLGVAHEFLGDRTAARQDFTEAIATSEASGNLYIQILATTGLGNIQFAENQL
ncbi:MAG: LuxR C-terminal-related transcriptional regulator, partial [Anaerolineales bacterium]